MMDRQRLKLRAKESALIKSKIQREFLFIFIGIVLVLLGVYLSVFRKCVHFYTPFSVGMLFLLIGVYNLIFKRKIFDKWNVKRYLFFSLIVIFICVIIDRIGLSFGYWTYSFSGFFDDILKYVFEWAVPFVYFMVAMMIGLKIFRKINFVIALVLSLIVFVTPLGLFTEFVNHFSYSWIILKMPLLNLKIGDYFVMFQIVGYWLMALIAFGIYKIVERLK